MNSEQNYHLSNEKKVADHLEEKCISLTDALEELDLDVALADDTNFCIALDFHILCCSDCGYWYLPCLMRENDKGEEICENCAQDEE